jgi:uncharacterized protein
LIDESTARRLAIDGALLAGPRLPATDEGVLEVARRLGGLQIDPTRTIERTELLVLWSRLGNYDRSIVERLTYQERRLFEHAAFYIPIERLPEVRFQQKLFANAEGGSGAAARRWIEANARFRDSVLDQLKGEGPLPSRSLDTSKVAVHWQSTGWTNNRDITKMLELMQQRGEVAIHSRAGQERIWDLPERVLPPPPATEMTYTEFIRGRSLWITRRMGVASLMEIRERSGDLPDIEPSFLTDRLNELAEEGRLVAVGPKTWRHADANPDANPTLTTLLSPFEPLTKDRARTERMWGFRYKLEMYVPKEKREFGHYTLPVLHHERLVGRLDAEMDRKANVLRVNKLHWENSPQKAEAEAADKVIEDLAKWLGAKEISRG